MKKAKSILITLTLLLVLVLPTCLVGCGGNNNKTDNIPEGHKAVIDITGNKVIVPNEVTKIASVGSGALRMLTYAGVQDKLVGIESKETVADKDLIKKPYAYVNREAFRELANQDKIFGTGSFDPATNIEALVKLQPQVVFASAFMADKNMQKLDKMSKDFGIPVVKIKIDTEITKPFARQQIRDSFRIIGEVFEGDVKVRCDAVVKKIDDTFADLDNRTKGVANANVYVGAVSLKGKHGLNYTYNNFPCLEAINTKNVIPTKYLGDKAGFEMSFEELIKLNPDVIFMDISNRDEIIKNLPQKDTTVGEGLVFDEINAIKNNKVYTIISYNYYSTNIEYAFANAYYMGKQLYPEKFADINIEDKINELTEFFDGVKLYDTMKNFGLEFKQVEDIYAI